MHSFHHSYLLYKQTTHNIRLQYLLRKSHMKTFVIEGTHCALLVHDSV